MSCRCRLGCRWKPCLCFRSGEFCSPKCQCTDCSNRGQKGATLFNLPRFGLILPPSVQTISPSSSSDPQHLLIPQGSMVLKQWRGFGSHHGLKLYWIFRLLTKLSCCFGKSEEYGADMAWFLCCEVVAAYAFQPSHPVCRILLTSMSNRLLCHLFEEGAGIFEPTRVVLFNQVFIKL